MRAPSPQHRLHLEPEFNTESGDEPPPLAGTTVRDKFVVLRRVHVMAADHPLQLLEAPLEQEKSDRSAAVSPDLSEKDRIAIGEFAQAVRSALGEQLLELRLFGSKVRGTANRESDIDIAVIVTSKDWRLENGIADLAFDVNVRNDVLIAPVIVTEESLHAPVRRISDLSLAVKQGSIRL